MKTCSTCKEEKPFSDFHKRNRSKDGYKGQCKECRSRYMKKFYVKLMSTEKGRERKRAMGRKAQREYRKNGKIYEYRKERRRNDPVYAITCRLRSRVRLVLQGNSKSASTAELTGCTWKELFEHLEKQFTDGMSWDNRHLWHVDHILPCASFDLSKPEEQRKCFHFSNLQPLWAKENLCKGSKILTSI